MALPEGRLSGESTISRLMQVNIPAAPLPDHDSEVMVQNEIITQSTTSDQIIIDNLESAIIQVKSMVVDTTTDSQGFFTLRSNDIGIEITEPTPTGDLAFYQEMSVIQNKNNMVFFFDYTSGNERIHMMHQTGSYFTFDEQGNYIQKSVGDTLFVSDGDMIEMVFGERNGYVQGDRNIDIAGIDSMMIEGAGQYWFGSDRFTRVGTNDTLYVNKNQNIYVQEHSYTQVRGIKSVQASSFYVMQSDEAILLSSPRIILNTNSFEHTSPISAETIGGLKQISAGALTLSSGNNISIGAGGNLYSTIAGVVEEKITGISITSLVPKIYAKKITLLAGDYLVNAVLGNVSFSAFQAIHLSAGPLGTLTLDLNIDGSIDLQNSLTGGYTQDVAGNITLSNPGGKLSVTVAGITQLDGNARVSLGAGTEPAVKGQSLVQWLQGMTVPTPVGPSGNPTSLAGPLTMFLSQKVFTE